MMQTIVAWGTEAAGLGVFLAAICRLGKLHVRQFDGIRHRPAWVAVFVLMMAAGARGVYEAAIADVSPALLLALMACGLYLWLSRHTWRRAAPDYLRTQAVPVAAAGAHRPSWPWPGEPGD